MVAITIHVTKIILHNHKEKNNLSTLHIHTRSYVPDNSFTIARCTMFSSVTQAHNTHVKNKSRFN